MAQKQATNLLQVDDGIMHRIFVHHNHTRYIIKAVHDPGDREMPSVCTHFQLIALRLMTRNQI